MAERWVVKSSLNDLYEYDGYARTIGGGLCIFLASGETMLWGPGYWQWAKNEQVPEVGDGPESDHQQPDVSGGSAVPVHPGRQDQANA